MAGILTFQVTVTGTAQQLPSNPNQGKSLTISAAAANTADIVISSTAANGATGFLLPKGTNIYLEGVTNTNALFVNGTSGDKVSLIISL